MGIFFLLARLLNPTDFGLVSLAGVYLSFLQVFVDQGFAEAIVQRHNLEREHLDTAFWVSICMSGVLIGVTLIAAKPIAIAFKNPEISSIICWLSLGFLLSALNSVQQALFRRKLAFRALAMRSIIAMICGGLTGVVMAFLNFGVWSLVGQQLVNGTVGVLVLWWAGDWQPGFKVSKPHFQELFSYSVNILGFNIFNFFNRHSDDFLIGYFLGSEALGYYTIAYRLLLTMTNLIRTLSQVGLPTFSRLQDDQERIQRGFYTASQLTSLVAFPVFMGASALAPELIPGLFGEQWLPSIPVMQILSWIGIVHSLDGISVNVIKARGKPDWVLQVNILNAILNVVAFILVVRWGIMAVAAAYVIRGYLIPLPIFWFMTQKLIGVELKTYLQKCSTPFVSTLIMVGGIYGTRYFLGDLLEGKAVLAICILGSAIVYVLAIWQIDSKLFDQVINLIKLSVSSRKQKSSL
ncbi:lipopolysaccharide biosynthesis protein [Laspinema sp. D6]|nr:lipopolysaccharide biosynthesis protein [Laspinema sp. D3a]